MLMALYRNMRYSLVAYIALFRFWWNSRRFGGVEQIPRTKILQIFGSGPDAQTIYNKIQVLAVIQTICTKMGFNPECTRFGKQFALYIEEWRRTEEREAGLRMAFSLVLSSPNLREAVWSAMQNFGDITQQDINRALQTTKDREAWYYWLNTGHL